MTLGTMDSLDFGVDRSTEVGRDFRIEEAERKERTNNNSKEQRENIKHQEAA